MNIARYYATYNSVTTELFPINTKDVRLAYELVQGQKFFKYKLKNSLKFGNDQLNGHLDYNYFKAIEASSLCSPITFRIDKLCEDNTYIKKWEGRVSIGKGKFDDDQCVAEFTADDINDYDCLLAGNEYNVLEIDTRYTVNLTRNPFSPNPIPNGILFYDALQFLATKCPNILGIKSEFFQWNPDSVTDINYVTGEFNVYKQLVIFQLTDYTNPPPTDQATIGKTSFKKIMADLNNMMNMYWTLENGYIRIEHSSYFFQNVGLDLTQTQFAPFLVAQNKYEYLFDKKYKFEEWSLPDSYQGGRITYDDGCAIANTEDNKLTHEINVLYPDASSASAVYLAIQSNPQRFMIVATETIGPDIVQYGSNQDMWVGNLILRLFRNDRMYENATFEYFTSRDDNPTFIIDKSERDYGDFRPISLDSLFAQKNLNVQLCCSDSDIDPLQLVKSNFGDGIIQSFEYNIIKNSANMSLEHGRKTLSIKLVNEILSLKGWWIANIGLTTAGPLVTAWADQSGNGNDFTAAAGEEPTFTASAINGQPSVDFSGGEAMSTASFDWAPDNEYTYFIVMKPELPFGDAQIFGTNKIGSGNAFALGIEDSGTGQELNNFMTGKNWKLTNEINKLPMSENYPYESTFFIFNENRSGMTSYGWHSGKRHKQTTDSNPMAHAVSVDAGPMYLGARENTGFDKFFQGSICEIIYYSRSLTDIERQYVEQYLFKKYAYLQSYVRY